MPNPLTAKVNELRAWQLVLVVAAGILLASAITFALAAASFGIADRLNGDKVRCNEIGGDLVERRYAEQLGWDCWERF